MKQLVAASRRDLRQPRLPWMIVQIGRFVTEQTDRTAWNSIQEQQRLLPGKIKLLETVAAIDLPLDDPIHIGAAGFPRLGMRLARVADWMVYGNKREARPPQFRGFRWVQASPYSILEIAYDCGPGDLRGVGEPRGFTWVSPADTSLPLIFRTEISRDKVWLHLIRRPDPGTMLHFGHGFDPVCTITDARDFSLPVMGPLDPIKPRATMPFVTQWHVTPIIPATKPLDQITLDEVNALDTTVKTFDFNGMVDEHALWENKGGLAFFRARLNLSEPMKVDFLLGYDGPIRLWLDGQPFLTDMAGINPCVADERSKPANLAAGEHIIHVGMDLNGGRAWGFFLRFARRDVTPAQRRSGDFVKAVYLA
jgi:sialate O-acetylesterase